MREEERKDRESGKWCERETEEREAKRQGKREREREMIGAEGEER